MFRHLRNRLIVMNLAVTTIVLVIAFSMIYLVAQEAAQHRKTVSADIVPGYTQIVIQTMNERILYERNEALRSLLVSLIIVGISVEVAVAFLSYILAEAAIRPVKEAYESQKVFIANASHEMKTPIAAIMANLEVADIQDNPWINNVSHEVKSLAALNQDLLTLARVENSMSSANRVVETVVLKDFVEEAIAPFQPRIKNQHIKFTFNTRLKTGKAKLAKNTFEQIISVLMDNAIKYCHKTITIELTNKSLSIKNDGATISAKDLSHIFDRFYQTNKSSEGVGLGLAIAKSLADREGWRLSATSDAKSTTFTLEF